MLTFFTSLRSKARGALARLLRSAGIEFAAWESGEAELVGVRAQRTRPGHWGLGGKGLGLRPVNEVWISGYSILDGEFKALIAAGVLRAGCLGGGRNGHWRRRGPFQLDGIGKDEERKTPAQSEKEPLLPIISGRPLLPLFTFSLLLTRKNLATGQQMCNRNFF